MRSKRIPFFSFLRVDFFRMYYDSKGEDGSGMKVKAWPGD